MAGSKSSGRGRDPDVAIIARKITHYAKTDPLGEKFVKYLKHVNGQKKSANSRCSSPWRELRTLGALDEIMTALKNAVFVSDKLISTGRKTEEEVTSNGRKTEEVTSNRSHVKDICNLSLSLLGNSFALDYSVREQAVRNGFIGALQQFISNFTHDSAVAFENAEILSRAIKCTANLSNDLQCREAVLKTGVAVSIVKILELADERVVGHGLTVSEEGKFFIDESANSNLICACVRAIRILASDSRFICGREHLLRFGGVVAVINVLLWGAKLSSNEELVLDVIRALTFLSLKIRSAPADVIHTLIFDPENSKIRCLVRLLEATPSDGKLFSPVINCLINLSGNNQVSDCLGTLRVFPILLDKLETVEESSYCGIIKLLIALTRYSSFNQSHLATSSSISSTLKLLKSLRFKEFHDWLLMVYEKLYGGSLSKLVQSGLVKHLCEILRAELEECDYDSLRKKISSLDDGRCSVHQFKDEGCCPFAPVYRCSSPSYQKIKEDMKFLGTLTAASGEQETQSSRGDDSLSPFSSPAHSVTSGSSSPVYSGASETSYLSFSEDEGCFSPGSSPILKRPRSCSPDEDGEFQISDEKSSEDCRRSFKKVRLEDGSCANVVLPDSEKPESLESLKTRGKKIGSVLNILHKCTHISPFPEEMLEITPILLGIIVRGKVSLMPQRVDYQNVQTDEEFRDLSRRTFETAYKIILRMCSSIQIFPQLIVSGIVPVLHRLQEPSACSGESEKQQMAVVQEYSSNLVTRMVGSENDAGWREGFLMRTLLVNKLSISLEEMNQTALNIPLLYEKRPTTLRQFEMKAKSWTKILDMLVNSDDTSFYTFEDCALALCSICRALGVKWKSKQAGGAQLPSLYEVSSDITNSEVYKVLPKDTWDSKAHEDSSVLLTLDDGTALLVNKDLLVNSSPVFAAMFNGHFLEADENKVHLPNVSVSAVCLLVDQINMQINSREHTTCSSSSNDSQHDMSTLFELFSLTDRFMLDDIYERALNTLITKYICPYSAPIIYAESVKLVSLKISGKHALGDSGLNLYILKYILTADGIRMSERCNAVRKVFDTVEPEHVVTDLKSLIEHNMYKSK